MRLQTPESAEGFVQAEVRHYKAEVIPSEFILKLRKEFQDIAVINVSTDVYEVLEMTGFTEIMTIEKAYRVLDVAPRHPDRDPL